MKTDTQNFPDYYEEGMPGYVLRDWEVVDYKCFKLDETELWFRGPAPRSLERGSYFTTIGAAQTFGCFCPEPYPTLLAERLGIDVLNLGYSGAGPSFFLRHPALLEYVNQSAFCIVQVMSGRSTGNALLDNPEGLAYGISTESGEVVTAESVFDDLLKQAFAQTPFLSKRLRSSLLRRLRLPIPSVRRLMVETRNNWVSEYHALMEAITVPKILFWFSKRPPFYIPRYHSRVGVFEQFPQMVNAPMVKSVRRKADRYVECVTQTGSPQPLYSRFTGEPTSVDLSNDRKPNPDDSDAGGPLYFGEWKANGYYPSPEMHLDGADALTPICRHVAKTVAHGGADEPLSSAAC